jgi:hypothetical protein
VSVFGAVVCMVVVFLAGVAFGLMVSDVVRIATSDIYPESSSLYAEGGHSEHCEKRSA